MKVSIIQYDIFWNDPKKNIQYLELRFREIEKSDLIILPEMFNTGFSIDLKFAETMEGESINFLKEKSKEKNSLIITSLLIKEQEKYFNRCVNVFPNGDIISYDKKHTFIGDESTKLTKGNEKIIVNWKGWKIRPLICYDLRFPQWLRNSYKNEAFEYDLLVCVANWPKIRSTAWKNLIAARAIENQSYSIGVNRIGKDNKEILYSGNSVIHDQSGEIVSSSLPYSENIINYTLDKESLNKFRNDFPFQIDWIKNNN